jgi:hypothetical protein
MNKEYREDGEPTPKKKKKKAKRVFILKFASKTIIAILMHIA